MNSSALYLGELPTSLSDRMNEIFHSPQNTTLYTGRTAPPEWSEAILTITTVQGKTVADIGCGGGIYSRAFVNLGAVQVYGIDSSEAMLQGAREAAGDLAKTTFQQGDAVATGLPDGSVDIALGRALIHHLPDIMPFCHEAFRILKHGGCLLAQDRTPQQCHRPGSPENIRGYFFELFPFLLERELERRYTDEQVVNALLQAGFASIKTEELKESRREYSDSAELRSDLLTRKGRSILFELTDAQLSKLTEYIAEQCAPIFAAGKKLIERDDWQFWVAHKL
jgi:ubiquinone/menaquinone biosynthesis C-methylase UbiE